MELIILVINMDVYFYCSNVILDWKNVWKYNLMFKLVYFVLRFIEEVI